ARYRGAVSASAPARGGVLCRCEAPDSGTGPHRPVVALAAGPTGASDVRLSAPWYHGLVCGAERGQRHGDRRDLSPSPRPRIPDVSRSPRRQRAGGTGGPPHSGQREPAQERGHPALVAAPSALPLPFHADLCLVAESRRTL